MLERLNEGVERFNGGLYYDAHEAWEDAWREATGEERHWLQGVVQAAVALHHASVGNLLGATSVLRRALRNLGNCPETMWGLDIARLRADLTCNRDELDQGAPLTRFRIESTGDTASRSR